MSSKVRSNRGCGFFFFRCCYDAKRRCGVYFVRVPTAAPTTIQILLISPTNHDVGGGFGDAGRQRRSVIPVGDGAVAGGFEGDAWRAGRRGLECAGSPTRRSGFDNARSGIRWDERDCRQGADRVRRTFAAGFGSRGVGSGLLKWPHLPSGVPWFAGWPSRVAGKKQRNSGCGAREVVAFVACIDPSDPMVLIERNDTWVRRWRRNQTLDGQATRARCW